MTGHIIPLSKEHGSPAEQTAPRFALERALRDLKDLADRLGYDLIKRPTT